MLQTPELNDAPVFADDFPARFPQADTTREPDTPRRPRSRRATWLLVGGLTFLLVAWRIRTRPVAHPEIQTARVQSRSVRATISATGKLQAFSTVDVKSRAGGTITKMAVEEGARVRAGQLLALIDRQDTDAAYRQAVADVDSARAGLRGAEENARLQSATTQPAIDQSVQSVASVEAALVQARENLALEREKLGPSVRQAQESVTAARAKLAQSFQALSIQRASVQTGIASARGALASAEARLISARESARAQPSLSAASVAQAQASVQAASASLNQARQDGRLLQASTQPQERAAVAAQMDQARSNLTNAQTNLKSQEQLLAKGFVAQNVVDSARNSVENAVATLASAQTRLDTLKDKQAAEIEQSGAQIENAQGQLAQARANLNSARANNVQNGIKAQDAVAAAASVAQSQAQLQDALDARRQIAVKEADVESARSALRGAQAELQSALTGGRGVSVRQAGVLSAEAQVRGAEAALRSARANVGLIAVKNEDVAKARAALERAQVTADNARTNLAQTRVLAPRDGIILKKYVDTGAIIQSGQSGISGGSPIVQLADVSRIYVDTQVDEADIAQIRVGQSVAIALDAYPALKCAGRVRKIFPQAEEDQNVTYVHVQVEVNPGDVSARLRPNLNATCRFLVSEHAGALLVPGEAVRSEGDQFFVTVIKDPAQPLWDTRNQQKRAVQVGVRGDAGTQITSGLREGETVVTRTVEPVKASGGISLPKPPD